MMQSLLEMEADYDQQVKDLQFFDAVAWLGRPSMTSPFYERPEDLRTALAHWGIPRALVSHVMGGLHDPFQGNQHLIESLLHLPGYYGVMTLAPEGMANHTRLENMIDHYLSCGLLAARILPKDHRYTPNVPAMHALFKLLEAWNIPLFIPIGQTRWDEICPIAAHYPHLPFFIEGEGHHEYLNIRGVLSWIESCPNILVPTSHQFLCGGLELMVERIGAHRILFATHQPVEHPAAAMALLVFSRLPANVRQRIAHGNLTDLLAGVGQGGYFSR